MNKMRVGCVLMLLALGLAPAQSQEMPDWARAEMERLANGGRWLADNAKYRSENEPYDSYGLEWRWGIGRQSVTGRLFGLIDGKEQGTFWEFRMFWHPGEGKLYLQQFGGDGTFGTGTVEYTGENKSRATQWFYGPDGTHWGSGHDMRTTPTEHESVSYDIGADGNWTKRRSYLWQASAAQ